MKTNPTSVSAETPAHNEKWEQWSVKVEPNTVLLMMPGRALRFPQEYGAMLHMIAAAHNASLVSAGKTLEEQGVFKGAEGLQGLADADSFWEKQEYGTRLYYGDGIADYLHRDVLRAACRALAALGAGKVGDEMCDYCENPSTLIRLCKGFRIATCADHESLAIIPKRVGAGNKRETDSQESEIVAAATRFCLAHEEDYTTMRDSDSMDVDADFMLLCQAVFKTDSGLKAQKSGISNADRVAIQKALKEMSELAELGHAAEKLAGNVAKLEYWKGELAVLHMVRRLLSSPSNAAGATPVNPTTRKEGTK